MALDINSISYMDFRSWRDKGTNSAPLESQFAAIGVGSGRVWGALHATSWGLWVRLPECR